MLPLRHAQAQELEYALELGVMAGPLTYFGDAKLSNGKSMPVVVTVKHRQNMPYIEVEIVK